MTVSWARHIPNFLTSTRIIVAFTFPFVAPSYQLHLIVYALLTEYFDGYLSRKFGWGSLLGQILDPVSDKLFFLCVGLTWVSQGRLSLFEMALIGTRDIGIAAMALGLFLTKNWMEPSEAKPL